MNIREKLIEVDKVKTDGALFCSKCQWYENWGKIKFLPVIRKKQSLKIIYMIKLQGDDGTITTAPKDVLSI